MKFTILRFDSIDSTNTEALKQASLGANEGLCVVAREQTMGRGRQGRVWVSPKDAGLYLSIVLRPRIETQYLSLIALAAAVAVYEALETLGLIPDIKWPNDVLVNEKKICGILAETSETDDGRAVVAGIGINLTTESIPNEIAQQATSIEHQLGHTVTPIAVEELLLSNLNEWYGCLQEPNGPSTIVEEWSRRSSYAKDKEIIVKLSNQTIVGITQGLESNGALRVCGHDSEVTIVQAGDVERLRQKPD